MASQPPGLLPAVQEGEEALQESLPMDRGETQQARTEPGSSSGDARRNILRMATLEVGVSQDLCGV